MEIASNNSRNFKLISAISLGHFMNDFYIGMIPPITFLFAKAMSLSLAEQGGITVASVLFGSLTQPFFGHYVDKKGKPILLLYSVLWISFFMSLSVLIKNYYLLLFIISFGSLASSLYHPLGSTLASNITDKSRGMSLSIFMTVGGFSISFVPIITLNMANNFGLSSLAFLFIPGVITVILMKKLGINGQTSILGNKDNAKEKVISKIKRKKILGMSLISISFVKVFLRSALVTYGVQMMMMSGYTIAFAGTILSIHLFLRPFGTIAGGFLSDKWGEKNVLMVSVLFGGISLILFAFLEGNISILGFLIWGFFFALSNSSNVTMMQKIFPDGQSMSTGLILGLPNAIGALFVLVFGKIADLTSLLIATKYSLILLIVAIVLVSLLPNEKKLKVA